jgi:palmitoyltransferase
VQYTWPPQDPSRLPQPRHFPTEGVSSDAAFVYGNSGFNPHLRPSNGSIRARQNRTASAEDTLLERHIAPSPIQASGQDDTGSMSSDSRSSSPEPYLSDYDEDNWGPMSRHADDRARRMRRGSEGWEVRPSQPWLEPDAYQPVEPARRLRPWEDSGRYNMYDPDESEA